MLLAPRKSNDHGEHGKSGGEQKLGTLYVFIRSFQRSLRAYLVEIVCNNYVPYNCINFMRNRLNYTKMNVGKHLCVDGGQLSLLYRYVHS